MSSDVELLDGAIPLVRNDEPWEWFVVFWEDPVETVHTDLTGHTVSAEIRWSIGAQPVTTAVLDAAAGQARLSLTAAQTAAMPLGRLSKLYIAIDADTEAVVPVDVIEGLFLPLAPPEPPAAAPVHVIAPASGDIVVLTDTRPVYVNTAPLAALTFRLPLGAVPNVVVDISFKSSIAALSMQDAGGTAITGAPSNAFGPGSGLAFQYVDDAIGWVHWT